MEQRIFAFAPGLPAAQAADTMRIMQWLLYGSMTAAVADALRKRGDVPHEPAELELASEAEAAEVLKAAEGRQFDILTTDPRLANAPFTAGFVYHRSMVFFQLEGGDVEQDDAVDRLFQRYKRLTPGRLYTVTATRVKVRQLPVRRSQLGNRESTPESES